jgi:hypothetical protein
LKRWVFRPVVEEEGFQDYEKLSPGERDCWGSDLSWREFSNSYRSLRILDLTCC